MGFAGRYIRFYVLGLGCFCRSALTAGAQVHRIWLFDRGRVWIEIWDICRLMEQLFLGKVDYTSILMINIWHTYLQYYTPYHFLMTCPRHAPWKKVTYFISNSSPYEGEGVAFWKAKLRGRRPKQIHSMTWNSNVNIIILWHILFYPKAQSSTLLLILPPAMYEFSSS